MQARCRCGVMSLPGPRNWNPDCPEHGLTSTWWNSAEQRDRREAQSKRLQKLQAAARAMRPD